MSGDVQPRKRKDKKKKKDDLGVEEPRGTAAALGEGDVFMHSHHEHGTGGHWCAKIIFFSLLAVLIGLIGLIILENRGLSELEAQAVESRYSGVLEGWLEDAPDDDHHDAHTLELKHHDDHDDDDHEETDDHDDEENGHDDDEDEENGDETEEDDHDIEAADDEDKRSPYSRYFGNDDEDEHNEEGDEEDEREQNDEDELDDDDDVEENDDDNYDNEGVDEENDDNDEENDDNDEENDDNDEDNEENGDDDENQSNEIEERDDDEDKEDNSYENNDEDLEDEEAGHDDDDEDEEDEEELEVEKIEHEASDEEPISVELPALPEEDDDDDDHKDDDDDDDDADNQPEQADADDDQADDDSQPDDNDQADEDDNQDDDDDFLDPEDDGDEPPIEKISAPAGKPFVEVEEETSSEKPPDTLEEEEEYEKLQEQKRQEEAQASHIWLKVGVGALLVAATHAVLRRASAGETPEPEETPIREATPLIDRRMTLIPEETEPAPKKAQELAKPVVEEVVKKVTSPVKFAPPPKQESEEEEQEDIEEVEMEDEKEDKELYSDEDEEEAVVDEEAEVEEKKEAPKTAAAREPTPESEAEEDVEIIDEVLDEDEEELEEEEISDVDDAELLTRLEEKYGRLPEPDRPGPKFYKDGGNSVEDDWPGEPSDPYWRKQLDSIDQELRQGSWSSALERASAPSLANSARARYLLATALDKGADVRRDNALLTRAIAAYIHLLKMNEELSDEKLLLVTNRTLQRIQFRGTYLKAEPVYKLLIRRFPNEPVYRNNLTVAFLMANRADLAENVLKETLKIWPNDRLALAHYGFVLKNERNRLEEAVDALQKALKDDTGPACEPRYYYHLGDALLLLGRYSEAHEVHKRGANHGHFLSPAQRSLYNVPRLKSRPWWNVDETPYARLARALEKSWKEILKEGEAARALYEKEREGLKAKGDWTQLDLFVRGQEIPGRCKKAPVTCSIVKTEQAAVGCRRGQIKFSAMEAGTHVRPHVGPTNCRIRMHLGLSNTKDTYIRVDQEIRQWQEGKVLMFDDSFEHEVWHNGTGKRLVLILDVWHPDLTLAERSQLPAI